MGLSKLKYSWLCLCLCGLSYVANAQEEDLLSLLEENDSNQQETVLTTATFKATRLINGHTIEQKAEGVLDFGISHRFGFLNGGLYELFGLDQATVRFGFDYGLTDRWMIGAGRSSVGKTYNGFTKFKLLQQQTGAKNIPLTLTYLADATVRTLKWADNSKNYLFAHRLRYTHQLLIARKFTEGTSIQIMPTYVHRNLTDSAQFKNGVLAIGVGGRQKITKRVSINAEYYYVLPNQINPVYQNAFAIGFDIETGGHVFQLHFTNATAMNEPGFIAETLGDWTKGDIRFGFNVSRVFTLYNPDWKG